MTVFLACEVSITTVTVAEFDKYNYEIYGFGKPDGQLDAEEILLICLQFQSTIFSSKIFDVVDSRLFEATNPSQINDLAKSVFMGEKEINTMPNGTTFTSRKIWVKRHYCADDVAVCNYNDGRCYDYWTINVITDFNFNNLGDYSSSDVTNFLNSGLGGVLGGWGTGAVTLNETNVWFYGGFDSYQQTFIANPANKLIVNKLISLMKPYNYSKESRNATKAVMDAMHYNEINGPYNQQHFNDIISGLSMGSKDVDYLDYWELFIENFSESSNNDPSAPDWLNYWNATLSTNLKFNVDYYTVDNAVDITYTRYNYDTKTYQPFNFSTQPWQYKADVLPQANFVKWVDGDNCLLNAKLMINSMGYDFSSYDAVAQNGVKQTFYCYNKATGYDANETLKAVSYIVEKVQQGIPVVVGVDDKKGSKNLNGLTDHYIIITGMVEENGVKYFTFVETGTEHLDKAFKPKGNRLKFLAGKGLVANWSTKYKIVKEKKKKNK
ncbi:MAG: hypothetical protein NTZ59_14605 [Bacteroidetes bacterium]|nr:hypothetical protein [Bacteroidota bacterium]